MINETIMQDKLLINKSCKIIANIYVLFWNKFLINQIAKLTIILYSTIVYILQLKLQILIL